MNAVGIDVSKGKSMVAIMRPFGEIVSAPFEIKHTASDIHSLVELINSVEGESRIVMEHTGRYYEVLAHQLSETNLFVSAINPKLIKDFDAVNQLNSASTTIESLRTLMNETASQLPEYPVVMAMKGVGTSLGPQLMAEIGDVSRFTHKGAITAFAGVDPGVNESGSYEQKSVPTSKRGSSDLRKTLFQVMDVLIKTHPQDDPVYQFLDKKRAQGKPYYVYMTAGANKFLRIYYGRVKEYLSSLPES